MTRYGRLSAVLALCLMAGAVLAGCDEASDAGPAAPSGVSAFNGVKKIEVDGKSVNVSCSGSQAAGKPVVVLVAGAGDGLKTFESLQQTLSAKNRVCSYDRLGEGDSAQPDGPQSFDSTGKVLTGVIGQLTGGAPVVLAGHSLGGLIVGRYAPAHQDRVKGVVLLDATSPAQSADLEKDIPASATGAAADLRDQTLAVLRGDSPEKLTTPDGDVASAGSIPAEVIQHGTAYLADSVPEYGPALERSWSDGQKKWLGLSSRSNLSIATKSGHYIYRDQPDLVVRAIERVTSEAAPV
ncbi:alpha/beta fold hydrolase [Amycolatopsis saalfeldensis]|uniref:Pimeloyl-ACP methyl ester carboxylesterase n=1 Tax=Amycolatopsis saalfeldensis TaxID=394193 RepID=A0A1H8VL65_9PSEU|nr:alpha/beta hydrolase [Amycolatopsis saalfeldensis]SEP16083.1 Pimeloyl-ACP methyl ester carboxylesterase [Amycolatopsis saalfeldensis]